MCIERVGAPEDDFTSTDDGIFRMHVTSSSFSQARAFVAYHTVRVHRYRHHC